MDYENYTDNDAFYAAIPPLVEPAPGDKPEQAKDHTEYAESPSDVPLAVIQAALNVIPAITHGHRTEWIAMCHAVIEANPDAQDLWEDYQARGVPHDGAKDIWDQLSRKPHNGGRGLLFKLANNADPKWWRDGGEVETWRKAQAAAFNGETPNGQKASPVQDTTMTYPKGYSMTAKGLYYQGPPNKDGDIPDPIWICDPFKILGRTSDEHDADHGLAIQFAKHEVIITNDILHIEGGQKLAATLSLLGLNIKVGKIYRGMLQSALGGVITTRMIRSVKTTGWHRAKDGNYIFMMPDKTYIGTDKDVLLATTPKYRFSEQGTLLEWQEHVAKYAVGNSRLTAFLCAAFHSVLLNIIPSAENSGIGLAGAARSGKTSALNIAESVWGRGDKEGCQQSWLATGVALEYMAAESCDCPLFLDEIQSADGRNVESMLYSLGNGIGKSRGQKDGGYREGEKWRIFILSTGEMTPTEKVKEATTKASMDGMVARLPTLPADAGKNMKIYETLHGFDNGAQLSDHIRQQVIKYYGTAIRPFLEKLVAERNDPQSKLVDKIHEYTNKFVEKNLPTKQGGIAQSVVLSFARDAVAGQLAKEWNIIPAAIDPAWALETCLTAYISEGGKALDGSKVTIVKDVRRFLQAHGDSRLKGTSAYTDDHAPIIRDLVGYKDSNGFYILPEQMEAFGHSETKIKKELDEAGLLQKDGERFKVRKTFCGEKMFVYHITPNILEGSDTD